MSTKGEYINIKVISVEARKAYRIPVSKLRSEGLNAPTIAKRLKLNRATVQDRVKRLDDAQGDVKVPEETKRGPKAGEHSYLSIKQQKAIQKLLIDKTPDQLRFNFALWTSQAVAMAIKERAKAEKGEIHWCDETCAKACRHRPRGYAPKGKTPEFRPIANQGVKVNIISSVTNLGKVRFMLSEKAFHARLFKEFMQRLIKESQPDVRVN